MKTAQRTMMPFVDGLSPLTDKSKQVPQYGGGTFDKRRTDFDGNSGGDHKFIGPEPDGVNYAVGGFFRNETDIENGDRDIEYSTEIVVIDMDRNEHVYPEKDYVQVMKDWANKRYIMMTRRGRQMSRSASSSKEGSDIVPVIADVVSACFKMECESMKFGKKEVGSCFAIDKSLFVTCAHVISRRQEDTSSISCFVVESGRRHRAVPVKVDYDRDLAIVSCKTVRHSFLQLKGISSMKVGSDILCVGSPYGYDNNVSKGMISSIGRNLGQGDDSYFFVDLAVYPGSSGGPVVDSADGTVIGVAAMIVQPTGNYGLNAAIPSEYVTKMISEVGNGI
jgi:S1-C subfamily serine protease